MRSLRRQLYLWTALGTAVVLLACGAALYALIGRVLRADFDASLQAKARLLSAFFEWEDGVLESDLASAPLPEFRVSAQAEFYEAWLADGTVFARSPSLATEHLGRVAESSGRLAFRTIQLPDGRPGRSVELQFEPRREMAGGRSPADQRVTLVVARSTAGMDAVLAQMRGLLAGVAVVAVALSAGGLGWVVRRSLRPVAGLSAQIGQVGERGLDQRMDPRAIPEELAPVVERLNDLLARLQAAFQRERRFTGDVAHELRTPLAGLRAKLELALAREREPGEYRRALHDCLDVSLQMQQLVENLLQLARADAGQLDLACAPVDVFGLAQSCWSVLQPAAAARGLAIQWNLRTTGVIDSAEEAWRVILRNLLDNAVAYAAEDSLVEFSLETADGDWVLCVCNDAECATEDAPRVFERFWRADPARRRTEALRCGLGLSLCLALVEQMGGAISAGTCGKRFKVTVCFPVARVQTGVAPPPRT